MFGLTLNIEIPAVKTLSLPRREPGKGVGEWLRWLRTVGKRVTSLSGWPSIKSPLKPFLSLGESRDSATIGLWHLTSSARTTRSLVRLDWPFWAHCHCHMSYPVVGDAPYVLDIIPVSMTVDSLADIIVKSHMLLHIGTYVFVLCTRKCPVHICALWGIFWPAYQ